MRLLNKIFGTMFDFEHILTPLAIEHLHSTSGNITLTFKVVYIFGVRVAHFSTV
jgi:hypothetical protein